MTELDLDQAGLPEDLPTVLPVLPLKETVVFPESMTPLAVGQERSISLIDDVVVGDRMLALLTVKDAETGAARLGRRLRVGTRAVIHKMIKVPDGTLRILVQGLDRIRFVAPAGDDPYLVGEFEELPGRRARLTRGRGTHPERAGPVRADHRADALPARGAAARRGERRRPERALPSRRLDSPPEDGRAQDLLETVDVEERLRKVARILGRELEVMELGLEDPVAGRLGDRQGPARVLPPPAAEGDPGRARRGRRPAGRDQRAARADRGERPARGRPQGGTAGGRPPRQAAGGGGRVRGHPHVPRLDPQPALAPS